MVVVWCGCSDWGGVLRVGRFIQNLAGIGVVKSCDVARFCATSLSLFQVILDIWN